MPRRAVEVLLALWRAWARVAGAILDFLAWATLVLLYFLVVPPLFLVCRVRLNPRSGWTRPPRQTQSLEEASAQF